MSDLRELYQEVILDHSRNPRNYGRLSNPTHEARGHNPLCGDDITIYLKMDGDIVENISFEGSGCAISTSSASLMSEMLKGMHIDQVKSVFARFHKMVTGDPSQEAEIPADLGKLAVMAGVREFPVRVKCATLGWHAVLAALEESIDTISTE
jgi:nitrogen fixation NifU-like protein